jgi:hypothetical protein
MTNQVHPQTVTHHLTFDVQQALDRTEQHESRPLKSPHLSYIPSEANPGVHYMVEVQKLKYLEEYNTFSEMHFMETLISTRRSCTKASRRELRN